MDRGWPPAMQIKLQLSPGMEVFPEDKAPRKRYRTRLFRGRVQLPYERKTRSSCWASQHEQPERRSDEGM